MYKLTTLFFVIIVSICVSNLKAQTNSFSSTASNKTWIVTKYYMSFSNEDKKDLFNNFSFKFLPASNQTFIAIDNSETVADTCRGFWHEEGNKVTLALTFEPEDKANYKIALLLNKAELQETAISSSKLSFRIPDVMGYIDVEFTEK